MRGFVKVGPSEKEIAQMKAKYPQEFGIGQSWGRQYFDGLLEFEKAGTLKVERGLDAIPKGASDIEQHAMDYAAPRLAQYYFRDAVESNTLDKVQDALNVFVYAFSSTLIDLLIERSIKG